MNLTEVPETVEWPETHYVFIEKIGPFLENAGLAWQAAHTLLPGLRQKNQITKFMSLYKRGSMTYRAGFATESEPRDLPNGFTYEKFKGGKYNRFVLTGHTPICLRRQVAFSNLLRSKESRCATISALRITSLIRAQLQPIKT